MILTTEEKANNFKKFQFFCLFQLYPSPYLDACASCYKNVWVSQTMSKIQKEEKKNKILSNELW